MKNKIYNPVRSLVSVGDNRCNGFTRSLLDRLRSIWWSTIVQSHLIKFDVLWWEIKKNLYYTSITRSRILFDFLRQYIKFDQLGLGFRGDFFWQHTPDKSLSEKVTSNSKSTTQGWQTTHNFKSFEGPVLNCRDSTNRGLLFKWISHWWNSEKCICNFSFSDVVN